MFILAVWLVAGFENRMFCPKNLSRKDKSRKFSTFLFLQNKNFRLTKMFIVYSVCNLTFSKFNLQKSSGIKGIIFACNLHLSKAYSCKLFDFKHFTRTYFCGCSIFLFLFFSFFRCFFFSSFIISLQKWN